MQVSKWNIEAETGYKPQTTFWEDFSIADRFGLDALRDTYQRSMELYSDLFYECREYALYHLTGEELNYFLRTTD